MSRLKTVPYLAVLLLPLSQIQAQAMRRESLLIDSSSAAIMKHLTARSEPSWFVDIMRQTRRPVAKSKLDELADSIVARAVANRASEVGALSPTALLALAGDRGLRKGSPYAGVLDRLIRIHQQATDYAVRTMALAAMPGVVGRDRGLSYLRTVATSNDSTSWYAVNVLAIDANGGSSLGPQPTLAERHQSEDILRALHSGGQVQNATAKRFLDEWILQKTY